MALQLAYTAPFRTVFPAAYLRVVKVDIDIPAGKACIEYWTYPDAKIRAEDGQATVERKIIAVYDTEEAATFTEFFGVKALSQEGANPIAAAYFYLKALGSFAKATDN